MGRVASDGALMSSRAERRLLAPLGMTLAAFCSAWRAARRTGGRPGLHLSPRDHRPGSLPVGFHRQRAPRRGDSRAGHRREHSFVAGLYENAPSDVPRIAGAPAWNAIAIFDGEHGSSTAPRSRPARSSDIGRCWTCTPGPPHGVRLGARLAATAVAVETFVSRADTAPRRDAARPDARCRRTAPGSVRARRPATSPPAARSPR